VFFDNRTYLEAIAVADRDAVDAAADAGNVFVKRLKQFTERHGEGFAMLAMKSGDAEADRARFAKAGFGGDSLAFRRKATRVDGTEREIGVTLSFAESPEAADAGFFACQHVDPEALFDPSMTVHANGAKGVTAAIAVADSPADFSRLVAIALDAEASRSPDGLSVAVGAQRVDVLTPGAFHARYCVGAPPGRQGVRFSAIELAVSDLDAATGAANVADAFRHKDSLIVPAAPGFGAVLALSEGRLHA
jgi:hypothetical protein